MAALDVDQHPPETPYHYAWIHLHDIYLSLLRLSSDLPGSGLDISCIR